MSQAENGANRETEPLDLQAINARWEAAKRAPANGNVGMQTLWDSARDVPRLLAEVRRCHEQLAEVAKPKTPICATCRDSICYVPGHGFGNEGRWEHIAPPLTSFPTHDAAPAIFVTPAVSS